MTWERRKIYSYSVCELGCVWTFDTPSHTHNDTHFLGNEYVPSGIADVVKYIVKKVGEARQPSTPARHGGPKRPVRSRLFPKYVRDFVPLVEHVYFARLR